jgi:hypothetical protein
MNSLQYTDMQMGHTDPVGQDADTPKIPPPIQQENTLQ